MKQKTHSGENEHQCVAGSLRRQAQCRERWRDCRAGERKGLLRWCRRPVPSSICSAASCVPGDQSGSPSGRSFASQRAAATHQLWPRHPRALPRPGPLHTLLHGGESSLAGQGGLFPVSSFLGHFPSALKAAVALPSSAVSASSHLLAANYSY